MPLPGVTLEVAPRPQAVDPLRTDVAVFLGRTRRGPVGMPWRVSGWTEFQHVFGGPDAGLPAPQAVRGYFENGGEVAWFVRAGRPAGESSPTGHAVAGWDPGSEDASLRPIFGDRTFTLAAASPGTWAHGLEADIVFLAAGATGRPEVTVEVRVPGEQPEVYAHVPPQELVDALSGSALVRLLPDEPREPSEPVRPPAAGAARRSASWHLVLSGGEDPTYDLSSLLSAAEAAEDLEEPALVLLPDADVLSPADRAELLDTVATGAAHSQDRLVLVDIPQQLSAEEAAGWVRELRERWQDRPALLRAAAVHHPPLRVRDPLGAGAVRPGPVPCCGHVAGVISRTDRALGPHHTAVGPLMDAVDVAAPLTVRQYELLFEEQVNLVRCAPGRGLVTWGGRTLAAPGPGGYVAHRRLLHRLVRVIRRVAAPLVFESNGPQLRLVLVRGVVSALVTTYEAGALAGARPEEAFQVRCDDGLNPLDGDPGQVLCEVAFAPATPMEFIRLLLVAGRDRELEVIEG
ncbi:phage tail protein [Streptomyces canus]|uniref:phage tail protein n=1 Tax=Streptomyces canus TaxID=58343 RepID=UPI00369E218E